jgi:Fic family protein
MEEAIASGMIEGASTTRKAAKSMLREGRRPRDRSERMILNNYRGMEHIMAARKEELSIGCILELHRIMTDGTLDNDAWEGRFRSSDEDDIVVADKFTGKVRHVPPPSSDVNMLMEELCRYANDDSIFTHPLIKGAIIHFIVAYIHPFADGNGRTARAMMYWHLLRNGYGIFEYLAVSKTIKEHRGRYDDAYVMCETDDLDITYFIRYNLRMMEESLGNLREYLGRKTKERMEFEAGGYGLNMRQEAILRDASKFGEPFGIRAVETEYGVAYQTARLDILKLEGLGLIRKHGRDANKVLYIFAGGKGKRPIP